MTTMKLGAGRCQFCHRTEDDVRVLLAGDSGFICDRCLTAGFEQLNHAQTQASGPRAIVERFAFERLERHFSPLPAREMQATSRGFPIRQQADLQLALDDILGLIDMPNNFVGILAPHRHEVTDYAKLLEQSRNAVEIAPPQYEEVDIGRGETVRCLKNGLWLMHEQGQPLAIVLSKVEEYSGGANMHLEVIAPPGQAGVAASAHLFGKVEHRLSKQSCYRGRVLSLEASYAWSGHAQRIQIHDLEPVTRETLILPERLIAALERNVLGFATRRAALRAMGLSTQKGLLFHGAPGTGKTHCIRWLSGQLPDHTTLLITAEQVGLLPEYMALARLLQPALVVIEDADLIARERSSMGDTCEEAMLNRLLNELDGLKEKADVFFILTTNRPEMLEPALVNRPGRIDQALEFPLPDEPLRRRLVALYARGLRVPEPLVSAIAARTSGASPAFIKELMRRIAQQHLESGEAADVAQASVDESLHDMLFSGGQLNKRLLGGEAVPTPGR
jgi:ATPase family associated with various cellular activities (AAA)/ClpX C4-type zinc finger